ncbi:AraC family transcriptional regulator [Sphingobacterium sp. HJSM2_6]|uniref:AraC family transcriptional regulator n=1 Tax=Sphingobacterium sp. HJSM2_6 TaxID=3366264 RepID=UPI003BDC488F
MEPFFESSLHSHQEFQLTYVFKGSGYRLIGNKLKPFSEGDMVLLGPDIPHFWKSDRNYFEQKAVDTCGMIVLYFDKNILGDYLYSKEEFQKIKILFERSRGGLWIDQETRDQVAMLLENLLASTGLDRVIYLLKILDKFACSKDLKYLNDLNVMDHSESEINPIQKVYDFVNHNFKRKIRLGEVADLANMTETSFSRYFKMKMSLSFSEFVKKVRINYACKRLNDFSKSIESISYECGFLSMTNFNKQFKQITGKTPSAYREEFFRVIVN